MILKHTYYSRGPVTCVRTVYMITIVCEYPQRYPILFTLSANSRNIQIILRMYASPSHILTSFDIDACSVGYDDHDVYCTKTAFIAFITQSITVQLPRRGANYEQRLFKYGKRGFEILIPDLDYARISQLIQ